MKSRHYKGVSHILSIVANVCLCICMYKKIYTCVHIYVTHILVCILQWRQIIFIQIHKPVFGGEVGVSLFLAGVVFGEV